MEPAERLVALEGAHNFRDLGGYPTRGGSVTRWGTLFRSDTLHELTPSDVEVLRAFGLGTIVDLRTTREVELTGRGLLASEPVAYRHLSVISDGGGEVMAAPAAPGGELSERYLWYLDAGRHTLLESLSLMTDPFNLPLVFHCAAGKDRTGVLAALVLDMVGVDREVIVADYMITAGRMDLILERYRSDPAFASRMARMPASRFGVEARSMERFIVELHARFGGARAWALAGGIAPESIDRMADLLLEPGV